ncbi:Di-glucose binding protein with Leucine-rich repeat domain-containing protein [Perilla frutescens var. hirtella]|uniref:Di-glucose binding protein with Leucine-rich repeat domain-containing protein n=1 Tax=Perilla frutescens var. hirtella TaxID=608512 RepID=A0AAD4JIN1_PERFH|nr:Di-glucose binding protein with Leucine-rich repeat domain-containing protein [Perilla frutescens var. hirtella]
MSVVSLFLLFSFFPLSLSLSSYPFNYSVHIDCGEPVNSTDAFHTTWLSDRFYSGGAISVVSEPLRFLNQQEKTLRYFPISSGKKNCYSIPTATAEGRYFFRTFTVYDNFDGKAHSPSFDVSVEGTLVFSWRSPWPESISRSGAYSDLFFYHNDSAIDVCFYSIATDPPVIGSLELTQIHPQAYTFEYAKNSSNYILVNYGRFSSGSGQWGPGFSNDSDFFGRSWQSDENFRQPSTSTANGPTIKAISTHKAIANVELNPNYFPEKLYQSASMVQGNEAGVLEYELPVDAKLDYLLWFHFAEIDGSVTKAGQRVFDVLVNDENVSRVDVFDKVGGFAAYDWSYVVKNLSNTILYVRLESVVGAPFICGLENYAIVPVDLKTVHDQVTAMKALKESLRVPDRMGWNGDPCAPTTWDAWEGVTCHQLKDEALVVSQIDLGSQGLKGYVSDQISLLTNLVSLNLSSNSLGGEIPSGLGVKSLVKLDLAHNKFTGYIPDSLTSSSLQLVMLNDNLLEGQVPEELYSIGVHGGAIDLSGNKGLCGVPPLPDCPLFWGKHGLSTGGKVAIGLSCLAIFSALLFGIYYCVVWRRRNDYDFGFPHEMMSLAAKRNRYHRQKSLMALEMESQHAKGFIPTYNVS